MNGKSEKKSHSVLWIPTNKILSTALSNRIPFNFIVKLLFKQFKYIGVGKW